jgi:hypothetical protein
MFNELFVIAILGTVAVAVVDWYRYELMLINLDLKAKVEDDGI